MEMHRVWSMFESLPADAKKEVVDFIQFLQLRNKTIGKASVVSSSDLRKQVVGMWADNDNVKDSTAWVRSRRMNEWNN